MTDRSKLLALAEAVEKLTGPDREVDMQIELTMGIVPAPYERATSHGRPQMYFWDRTDSHAPYITPEKYTASLDCAMMLVPMKTPPIGERFRIEGYDTNGVLQPHVRASAWVVGAARVFAATPALALCAAALRAQAEALA